MYCFSASPISNLCELQRPLVIVALIADRNLAPKEAIDDAEVHDRQTNANRPPEETDVEGVWSRKSLFDRKIFALRPDCGKNYRE
jgi:hypothetical protein